MKKLYTEKQGQYLAFILPWFNLAGTPMTSAMARGFECYDGWLGVIWWCLARTAGLRLDDEFFSRP